MEQRTRVVAAAAGTVVLFLCVQLGALALVGPYEATGAQPVEDPSDPGNVGVFFGVILLATAGMLVAIRYDLERVIRGAVVLSCGWIAWLVLSTLATTGLAGASGVLGSTAVVAGVPVLGAAVLVVALLAYPEWYVIDAAGILLGAGAAGLFGLAFTPRITILFLVVLAAYDAVSVYGTEHMLALAEGVSDLNLPVLLVVPTVPGFSLLDDSGPAATVTADEEDAEAEAAPDSEADGDAPDPDDDTGIPGADGVDTDTDAAAEGEIGVDVAAADGEADADVAAAEGETDADVAAANGETDADAAGADDETGVDAASGDDEPGEQAREAMYIGLGDAVMPTILVASAVANHPDSAPLLDVPLIALSYPALGAAIGTLLGLVVLLALVLRGRAHAGLPLLNGGAIAGFLLGAVASGLSLVELLELPL